MKTLLRGLMLAGALLATSPGLATAQTATGHSVVTATDRVLGRADAPVTVIEYASFVCSHCAAWHNNVLPAFKTRFIDTGQVRLVFRNLPTDPVQVSASAAGIARCAAPAQFFDVASSLMRGQAAVIAGGPIATWFADAIAASGRTRAQIETCLADPATLEGINADVDRATGAGVEGTPAFFVNGRAVADTSLDGLTAAIRPHLPRN